MQKLTEYLNSISVDYRKDVSLRDISTFRIGGNANIICYPSDATQVSKIVCYCKSNSINFMTFGRCSNVVFADEGLSTLIIKTDRLDEISFVDGIFSFGAGVMLAKASKYTVDNGYKGMEFAYGIPGSVGGAVYMNAGAYGGEMKQCVIKTQYVNQDGDILYLEGDEHSFSYRHSFFSDSNNIITKTFIKLDKGNTEHSINEIQKLQEMRKTKQPLEYPSAGSVFKRPEGYFAGKLIQDCNLRGYSIGGAAVSEKHAGFIINVDNASCKDVKQLVSYIQSKVLCEFGVKLECELKFIED